MDLSRIIIGEVVTEKAVLLKGQKTHTLRVDPQATKVDVRSALRRYYGVDVGNIRVLRTASKRRQFGRAQTMVKRRSFKHMMVTLKSQSKPLDIASFKS